MTFNVSIDLSNIHNNPINAHYVAMTSDHPCSTTDNIPPPFIFRGVFIFHFGPDHLLYFMKNCVELENAFIYSKYNASKKSNYNLFYNDLGL